MRDGYVTIGLMGGRSFVIDAKKAREACIVACMTLLTCAQSEAEILTTYAVPSPCSPDLQSGPKPRVRAAAKHKPVSDDDDEDDDDEEEEPAPRGRGAGRGRGRRAKRH